MGRQPVQDAGETITARHAREAGIQYAVTAEMNIIGTGYWIIRFRG